MRNFILLLPLLLIGCSTPSASLPPKKSAAIKSLLAPPAAVDGLELASESPRHETTNAPITMTTKFAGACPYCQNISVSKTCRHSGGTLNPDGSRMESWTITFLCPSCHMPFNDYRSQIVAETQSIRLPARD